MSIIDTLIAVLPEVMPMAVGLLSPTGLAYTLTTVAAGAATHFFSSAFVAATPTPKPESKWAKIYKIIEVLALAIGKAKNK